MKNSNGSNTKKNSDEEKASEQIAGGSYLDINIDSLVNELRENKALIKMTEGKEDGDGDTSGSDSDPSEDNLEEEEMAKIVPIKLKKKKVDPKKKIIPQTEKPMLKKKA